MKKIILLLICFAWLQTGYAQENTLSPFFKVETSKSNILELTDIIKDGLEVQKFNIIGEYPIFHHPFSCTAASP